MSNINKRDPGIRQKPAEYVQNFEDLRNQCLKKKILFRDPEFDAIDSSLYYSRGKKKQYEWRRPNVSI